MAEVKVLLEGYYKLEGDDEFVQPTMTLVRDEGIVMVVDPGTMKDKQMLIDALKKEGLKVKDVNYVCITHSHPDHYMNLGLFPNAKVLDYWGIWEKDTSVEWNSKFTENIEIVKTPGHSYDNITLFVKTNEGITAVVGDVFAVENPSEEDPFAQDIETLKKSRQLVLKKAQFIIPGHGNKYEVE